MLIDTGGIASEVLGRVADELHAQRQRAGIEYYDVSGQYTDKYINTPLDLGMLHAPNAKLVVSLGDGPYHEIPDVGGILAPDILQNFDVDIDFGTQKLNLFSKDHCAGHVVYWTTGPVAVVPFRFVESGHIVVEVELDGKPAQALLDTGAYNTSLYSDVAQGQFGLVMGSADTPESGELRPGTKTYHHLFKSLSIGGVAINNIDIDIFPNLNKGIDSGTSRPDLGTFMRNAKRDEGSASMLLGMNVLRHLHVYIAYGEEKLYISGAGAPPQ